MKRLFYSVMVKLSKRTGPWLFVIFTWIVTSGFFMFFPRRVGVSVRFYRDLFPERGRFYHLWCAWRQYHNFSYVFLDRFLVQDLEGLSYTSEGWEYLEEAQKKGTGGIILMSHMGNWEVAAHLLKKKSHGMRLLLYMGIKQKEQIEGIQKDALSQEGISVVGVEQEGGSPFEIIEGIRQLQRGGFVSMTGDRVWSPEQRVIPVRFLGREVLLPEVPHILALLSGSPIFIFFSFRTGKRNYRFTINKPRYVRALSRSQRGKAISRSAQEYAGRLEEALYQSPLEWYHFEPFFDSEFPNLPA